MANVSVVFCLQARNGEQHLPPETGVTALEEVELFVDVREIVTVPDAINGVKIVFIITLTLCLSYMPWMTTETHCLYFFFN